IRLNPYGSNVWVVLSESSSDASERASSSESGYKMGHSAFGLFPNFFSRRFVVAAPVRLIVILIEIDVFVRKLLSQLPGKNLCSIGSFGGTCFDYLYSIGAQDVLAFSTCITRQT